MASPKVVDVIQLAPERELDSEGDQKSNSNSEDVGDQFIKEEEPAQGEPVMLALELVNQHPKGDTDSENLAQ